MSSRKSPDSASLSSFVSNSKRKRNFLLRVAAFERSIFIVFQPDITVRVVFSHTTVSMSTGIPSEGFASVTTTSRNLSSGLLFKQYFALKRTSL